MSTSVQNQSFEANAGEERKGNRGAIVVNPSLRPSPVAGISPIWPKNRGSDNLGLSYLTPETRASTTVPRNQGATVDTR